MIHQENTVFSKIKKIIEYLIKWRDQLNCQRIRLPKKSMARGKRIKGSSLCQKYAVKGKIDPGCLKAR